MHFLGFLNWPGNLGSPENLALVVTMCFKPIRQISIIHHPFRMVVHYFEMGSRHPELLAQNFSGMFSSQTMVSSPCETARRPLGRPS